MAPMNDDALAHACREDEFVRLLSEHRHVLFNYILCVVQTLPDAEDVFQQTTLSLWNNFHQFHPNSDFQAWAIRFARYRVLNFVRSKRRQRVFFSDKIIEQLAENSLETADDQELRLRALAACRKKLSPVDQTLLEYCYGRCDTIREAAIQLGRPLGAVYESLWRVRRALHACIKQTLTKEGH
jgi:RNA polymerase sigma-70 factor, ECF subfamily